MNSCYELQLDKLVVHTKVSVFTFGFGSVYGKPVIRSKKYNFTLNNIINSVKTICGLLLDYL